MSTDDDLKALSEVQAQVIVMRRTAAETKDARKWDACLRLAVAIEKRARELDQSD